MNDDDIDKMIRKVEKIHTLLTSESKTQQESQTQEINDISEQLVKTRRKLQKTYDSFLNIANEEE